MIAMARQTTKRPAQAAQAVLMDCAHLVVAMGSVRAIRFVKKDSAFPNKHASRSNVQQDNTAEADSVSDLVILSHAEQALYVPTANAFQEIVIIWVVPPTRSANRVAAYPTHVLHSSVQALNTATMENVYLHVPA